MEGKCDRLVCQLCGSCVEGGAPFGNSEKIKFATPFWKTQKMCEVDCPRALLKIFKLPLPFGGVSRCVMFADHAPRVWCCVVVPRWCLCLAGRVCVVLCVRVCMLMPLPLPCVFAV